LIIDYIFSSVSILSKLTQLENLSLVLKYCKLSLQGNDKFNSLSIATTKYSLMQYLTISNKLYVNELNVILLYIPQIGCLSIDNVSDIQFRKFFLI
jgi:hypothetical protein